MANKCQIQTPKKYVIQMLNFINYKENLFGKRLLENSCGEGKILIEVVKRYITDAEKKNKEKEQIAKGLERDIAAFEIDQNKLDICINSLNSIIEARRLPKVVWNIKNEDFLKQPNEKYDFIIGNPPYITYHDLEQSQREYLKDNFISCKEGRFDYSYAFIEASVKSLSLNGKLVYLLPYSIIKNKYASKLREYINFYITTIYDYTGIKIFPDAITSSVILLMENKLNKNYVRYHHIASKQKRRIARTKLNDKWNFVKESEIGKKRFGDYFDVCNSVATLFNKAYIIDNYKELDEFYCVDGITLEKQIVYPAISMKSYNKKHKSNGKDTLIIFPYNVLEDHIEHFSDMEFRKKFPNIVKYLEMFQTELEKRNSDKNALWFEYGRSQAISRVFGEKIVIPMVITNSVSVCSAAFNAVPYAGYFIKCVEGSTMTLNKAKEILESKDFYSYVKAYGTPTTPTSYRISVNDIKEYRF